MLVHAICVVPSQRGVLTLAELRKTPLFRCPLSGAVVAYRRLTSKPDSQNLGAVGHWRWIVEAFCNYGSMSPTGECFD